MIRIAEFSRSENPNNAGTGIKGNQLISAGDAKRLHTFVSELSIRPLSGMFTNVFRPLDVTVAEKIAAAAEATCRNVCCGYSWDTDEKNGRMTFWNALCEAGMVPERITTACNGDCSAGVAAWCNVAGVEVVPNMTTRNEELVLMGSGAFMKLEGVLTGEQYLHRGDVLHRIGHTAVVLDDYAGRDGRGVEQAPMICIAKSTHLRTYPKVVPETQTGKTVNFEEIVFIEAGAVNQWAIVGGIQRAWVSTKYLRPFYPVRTTGKVHCRVYPALDAETLTILECGDTLIGTGSEVMDPRGVIWHGVLTPDRMEYGFVSSKYSFIDK